MPGTVPLSARPPGSAIFTSSDVRLARAGHGDDGLHDRHDAVDHRPAEHARRQAAARDLGERGGARAGAGEPRLEQPLADPPLLERVELDRQGVLDLVVVLGDADPEPLAQERAHGMAGEADEVLDLEQRRRAAGERAGEERAGRGALAGERPGAVERDAGRSSTAGRGRARPA